METNWCRDSCWWGLRLTPRTQVSLSCLRPDLLVRRWRVCPESSIVHVQPLCLLAIFTNCLQCSNFYTLLKGSLCVLIAEGNISGISNHGNESFSSPNGSQLQQRLGSSTPHPRGFANERLFSLQQGGHFRILTGLLMFCERLFWRTALGRKKSHLVKP